MTETQTVRQLISEGTGSTFETDERFCLVDMERAEPKFFKTKHGKRETFTEYRGQLIVRHTTQFTGCRPERLTAVYVFVRDPDEQSNRRYLLHATSDVNSVRQAKRVIDRILEEGKF